MLDRPRQIPLSRRVPVTAPQRAPHSYRGRRYRGFKVGRLRLRLDGGFAGEDVLGVLEAEGGLGVLEAEGGLGVLEAERVEYVALGGYRLLDTRGRRLMGLARMLARASGETEHLCGETRDAARKWRHKRRGISKAGVVRRPGRNPKNNPRFVVTNLSHTPEHVYALSRGRGDVESRIKELKDGVALDRLRYPRFQANQFRLRTAEY